MKFKTSVLFFLALILITYPTYAQVSVLQDKMGETSILINDTNQIAINTGDASIVIGLSLVKPKTFYGINVKLKAESGVSNILEGYELHPNLELGVSGGLTINSKKLSVFQFIFGGITFTNQKFNLFTNDSTNNYSGKNFHGLKFYIGYNRTGALNIFEKEGLASSYLFGSSICYSLDNNLKDIKSVDLFASLPAQSNGNQSILLYDKKSGYKGNYSTYHSLKINIDAYIFPQLLGGNLGIGGYLRSQLTGGKPRNNLGIGALIGQKNAPSNIVLGILYQFNDVFNQLNKENEFLKRGGINLIAGYKF
jgi:hypothetical protein